MNPSAQILTQSVLELLTRQLGAHFPPPSPPLEPADIAQALERFTHCLRNVRTKYIQSPTLELADFYNSDKYALFLAFLARGLYLSGKPICAAQVYYLNKIFHALDIFYEVEIPSIFLLTHPVGSVLGRARYSDYFCAYHNCTVGSSKQGEITHYPSFGRGVLMYGGSRVIGKCTIGDNVIFGANAFIIDTDVPSHSVVVGTYPNHRILPSRHNVLAEVFGCDLSQHKEVE